MNVVCEGWPYVATISCFVVFPSTIFEDTDCSVSSLITIFPALAHAPKTPRFGAAYEEATNASYLNQLRTAPACPDTATVNGKLDALGKRLQDALPPAPPAAQ